MNAVMYGWMAIKTNVIGALVMSELSICIYGSVGKKLMQLGCQCMKYDSA